MNNQEKEKLLNNFEFRCGLVQTLGNLRKWYQKNSSEEFYNTYSSLITLKCFDWKKCSIQIIFDENRVDYFDYEKLVELEILDDYLQEYYSLFDNFHV